MLSTKVGEPLVNFIIRFIGKVKIISTKFGLFICALTLTHASKYFLFLAGFEVAMSNALKSEAKAVQTDGDANKQFKEFKDKMLVIRSGIFQSDENLDAKYEVAKEFITFYISRFTGSLEELKVQLQKLCHEEFIIPTKLQDWSFQEAERIMDIAATPDDPLTSSESPPKSLDSPAPLFNKDNVYHCMLLCRMVLFCDGKKYESFLSNERHGFQNVSLSLDGNHIERYAIARKDQVLYVAFLGEKNIYAWQDKYTTFNEGDSLLCIP